MNAKSELSGNERVVIILVQNVDNPLKICIDCVKNTSVTNYLEELKYFGYNVRPDGRTPYSREFEISRGEKIFFNIEGINVADRRESTPQFIQLDDQKVVFVSPRPSDINDDDDFYKGTASFFKYSGTIETPPPPIIKDGPLFTKIDVIQFKIARVSTNKYFFSNTIKKSKSRTESRKTTLKINLPVPREDIKTVRDYLRESLEKQQVSSTILLPSNFTLELPLGFHNDVVISGALVDSCDRLMQLDDYEVLVGDVISVSPNRHRLSREVVIVHDFQDPMLEIVIKCSPDGVNDWVALETVQIGAKHKAFIDKLQYFGAVSRPVIEHYTVTKSAQVCTSSVSSNIKIDIPALSTDCVRQLTMQVLSTDSSLVDRIASKDNASISVASIISVTDDKKKNFNKPVSLTMPLASRFGRINNFDDRTLVILADNDDDEWHDVTDMVNYKIRGDNVMIDVKHFSRYTNARCKPKVSAKKLVGKVSTQTRSGLKLANLLLLQHCKDKCSLCVECVLSNRRETRLREMMAHGFVAPKGKIPYGPDIEIKDGEDIFFAVRGRHVEAEADCDTYFLMQFHSRSNNHRMVQVKSKDANKCQDMDMVGYIVFLTCVVQKPGTNNSPMVKVPGRRFEEMRFTIPKPRIKSSRLTSRERCRMNSSLSSISSIEEGGTDVMNKIFMHLADNLTKEEWKPLGYTLGLSTKDFSNVTMNHQEFWEQKYQMFLLWQQIKGMKATTDRIVEALKERKMRKLAESVKKIIDADDVVSLTYTDITFYGSSRDSYNSDSISDLSSCNGRITPSSPISPSPRPWTTGGGFVPIGYRPTSRIGSAGAQTDCLPPICGKLKPLQPAPRRKSRHGSGTMSNADKLYR
ncbi:uncharacterized protein LOC144349707 [Saccoglossus kowalevskii]